MRAVTRFLAALGVLLIVTMPALSAQHAQTRGGLRNVSLTPVGDFAYGHLGGLSWGDAVLSCSPGCFFDRAAKGGGLSGFVKLGMTLRPDVLLGAEFNAWTKDVNGTREWVGNVSGAVYYYLTPSGGLFLKAGAGYATFQPGGGTPAASGVGLVAGAGYDIRIAPNVSITPVGNFYFGSDGETTGGSPPLTASVKHSVFELGVGITLH